MRNLNEVSLRNEYFEWLFRLVNPDQGPRELSYDLLLRRLHDTDFRWILPRDQNRAEDGRDLRYRFALTKDDEFSPNYILHVLAGPCSVLEMMIALTLRCEETIMDDPSIGDRTSQWFWGMVVNLGLGSMIDSRYDERFVDESLDRFLSRNYDPDGRGGLFTIRHCDRDLRDVEIWVQLLWYLDNIGSFSI